MNPFFVFAPAVFQGGSVNDTAFLRKNGRDTPGKPGIAHGFRINAITGRRHRISVFCRPAIRTSEERQDMPAVRYPPRSPPCPIRQTGNRYLKRLSGLSDSLTWIAPVKFPTPGTGDIGNGKVPVDFRQHPASCKPDRCHGFSSASGRVRQFACDARVLRERIPVVSCTCPVCQRYTALPLLSCGIRIHGTSRCR